LILQSSDRVSGSQGKIGFQAAGIKRIRWQTNNDELVCRVCRPLNQQVKPIGETFGEFNGRQIDAPLAHPNCRCWITPVANDV
jgi:hypothetical protein